MLHPTTPVPPPLMSKDSNLPNQSIPICAPFLNQSVPPPRPEFQSIPPQIHQIHQNNQPVFSSQDIDLRSLGPSVPDPRMSRMQDQDMRSIPGALPNPLPPPVAENFNRDPRGVSSVFPNDPRGPSGFPSDPRIGGDPRAAQGFMADPRQGPRPDPRQKPGPIPAVPQIVRPPPQVSFPFNF